MSRYALATFLVCLLAASATRAPGAVERRQVVYPLVFPVVGENHFSRDFGDPRTDGRPHEGIDILAEKLTPVVAVADGKVGWMFDERGGDCCSLSIVHDDGWRSRYIHLNNDTPGTDDGKGFGLARGIRVGARVRAGQVIGFVGDSGNAEATAAHLHFELRRPDGTAVDAFTSLEAALTNPAAAPPDRIAGPAVRPPQDLRPEVRRPRRAPHVEAAEPLPRAITGAAPGEDEVARMGEAEPGRPLPVTPFVPVPADDCSRGFDRQMELAEVRTTQRPTFSCFGIRPREGEAKE
jgi:murein DD-endopeptidase MepM/ murein hydrolase activator NlpD